ncbi:heparan-alpha-glucosaminide N-acetyltransferase-like isoform X2 [Punica granatum]|nr:heparan-alpha-glucosaminide N-acetyltransferase-like isoform X2 [Punica granatum]
MADYLPLPDAAEPPALARKSSRVASVDVFRGLCVFLMMLVDYGGSMFPAVVHSPWDGLRLADFVMPFFLFIAGVSLALVYKKVTNRVEATWVAVLRAVKLFLLGVFLQGGYLHGRASLAYGVDIERIRWFGVLQRISVGYIVAALCEIWLTCRTRKEVSLLKSYWWQWSLAIFLSAVYLGLLYGLYVPDWQFEVLSLPHSLLPANGSNVYTVKCSMRGDLGPACNSAGMIDRHVVGINHLYTKPFYRNLEVCNMLTGGQVPQNSPPWCHAPFDPEGILSSLTAAVTCIIGLQYGHILADIQDPRRRLKNWCLLSVPIFVLGAFFAFIG